MDGKVILIEGLDLAGKSTLVRNVRDELTRRGLTQPGRVFQITIRPT
jgi:thymidylate kinase